MNEMVDTALMCADYSSCEATARRLKQIAGKLQREKKKGIIYHVNSFPSIPVQAVLKPCLFNIEFERITKVKVKK